MASPGNQHCANCIDTLSFPMVGAAVPDAKRFSELEHLAIDELLQHWHRAILIQHNEWKEGRKERGGMRLHGRKRWKGKGGNCKRNRTGRERMTEQPTHTAYMAQKNHENCVSEKLSSCTLPTIGLFDDRGQTDL